TAAPAADVTKTTPKVALSKTGKPIPEGYKVVEIDPTLTNKNRKNLVLHYYTSLPSGWKEFTEMIVPINGKLNSQGINVGVKELKDLKNTTAAVAVPAKPDAAPAPTPKPDGDVKTLPTPDIPSVPAAHKPQLEKVMKNMPCFTMIDPSGEEIANVAFL